MDRNVPLICALIAIQILMYLYKPSGYFAYFFPSICWISVALIALWSCDFRELLLNFNNYVLLVALMASLFQIIMQIDGGLFSKYGRSPVVLTPVNVILNLMMISASLIGSEFSRSCILRSYGKRKFILAILIVSIFYSRTFALISMLYPPVKPFSIVEFLGSKYLPDLAVNLLASYLAFISGPLGSIVYLAPLKLFQWFSPILPDLTWGLESLIGVVAPTVSLIVIDNAIPLSVLRRAGLRIEFKGGWSKDRPIGFIVVVLAFVFAVWLSTGLLGVFPSVVLSGSMRPTMDVGDIALVVKVPASKIKPGDVILYFSDGGMTLHRVMEIRGGRFITKGDANKVIDFNPIHPSQVKGKLLLVIPKIGWISIYLKRCIGFIVSFIHGYYLLSIVIASITVLIAFYYARRMRRKFGRWCK